MGKHDAPIAPGLFDFGLTQQQEQRAARLHLDCLIFDAVNQHPGGGNIFSELPADAVAELMATAQGYTGIDLARELPYRLAVEGRSDAIRRWWRQSGVSVGTIDVPTNLHAHGGDRFDGTMQMYASLGWLKLATSAKQIRANHEQGIVSMWGYDQPVGGIPNEIDAVDQAYRRGLRTLMLTYNRMDYVGQGCTERVDAGLSMYGVDVVRRCNELGIIVDTSHCSERTTLDACKFSKRPVIANHTGASGVYAHARGKSDQVLDAIAASGGVVGVCTVPFFLSADPAATIEVMLDHIDYIVRRIGAKHVGLGTDWPLQGPDEVIERTLGPLIGTIGFRPEDNISPTRTLVGFDDYRDMPNITRGLVARGYSDADIAGILGENHLRVIEQVCG
jgi:membrane dipeptidase